MRICTTSIFVIIIYQTYVFTAPVNNSGDAKHGGIKTKFGKIADVIINPKWTLHDPDSKKPDQNDDPTNTDPNNTNDVNDPLKTNNDPDDSYNDKKRRPKKNNNKNRSPKKSNNNRNRNKRKQKNTRSNGKYRWYRMVTVDYLLVNLPEYRNHEDEKKIVLIWGDGDKRKIVLNEHINELPMENLNNNELIRKKRDYNNTFQLQDKLQNKNDKQHDSKGHGRKAETQNKIRGNTQNKQNIKQKKTYENLKKSGGHDSFEEDSSLIDNLEEDENSMNSNIIDNTNENMKFLNSNKNKYQHIVKNRKHPTNTSRNKLRRPNHAQHIGKNLSNNHSETERSYLKTIKKMPENVKETSTISDDVHEFTIKENADTATSIPKLGEIDTLIDEVNSISDENQTDQNYESYSSSLETKQEIQNFSDIEDNKEHDILYNIRHPVKSKPKNIRKNKSANNAKPQNEYEKRIGKPLEINNVNKKGSQKKTIKPNSINPKDILIISFDEPNNTTEVKTDIATKIPAVDEIETLMDKMNSNSDENLDDQPNESFQSSLETKQEIPNYSDIEDNKERDLLKNIRHPLKPKSKKFRKKLSHDYDEVPKTNKQTPPTQLKVNNSKGKGSQQNSIEPLPLRSNHIPSKSNDISKKTKGKTTKIPAVDEIDTLMNEMNSNSDENLDDQNNESFSPSLETKRKTPSNSDIEDNKERDILNNIQHQFKPNSKTLRKKLSDDNDELPKIYKQKPVKRLETNNSEEKEPQEKSIEPLPLSLNKIISTSNDVPKLTKEKSTDIETTNPEVDEIDTLMNEMNSNSDENLDDQNNESFSPSLETKRKTPSNSDIEDNKERDILNNIQHQFKPNSKTLRKKLSDDNDELPKIYKQKPVKRLETNNSEEKEPQEKSIEPLPLNLNKIISTSNDVPKLTKGKSTDIETTNPEVDEIDTLMNEMNSNSDENLDDQNNESFSPSLETKRKTPSNSDIEDNKERDILNNIQHQFKPNSKTLRKKLSDDNDELPKIYKQKPVKRLETNNSEEKEPQEKSIEPLPLNLNKIISTSNDVPKLTKGKSTDIETTNPEVDEIDTLMNEMNSNSDENLDDQNNESFSPSLETKRKTPSNSDIEDNKERDILNNIQHQFKPNSKTLRKKLSDDNDELPKIYKQKPVKRLETNNSEEKEPQEKSIEPLPLSLNKIISTSNDVPKLTKEKSTDIETTNPEVDEIDTLMNEMNSNSDENLDDQNNESFSPSLETKRKTPSNSDIEDNKERDILNNIQHQFKPNSKTLRKKLSDDNDELPKIYKQKPVKRLETNNSEEKEPQEKSIEPLPLNLNKIISTSNDVPKLTKGKSTDIETTNPEVDEIDTLMNEMNSNSDENLDDQNNESFSPSLETKRKTPSNSDIEDNKERDILNNIQHQFKPNSKTLRKKLSDDNDELPKIYKQKPVKRLETNNSEEKEPQEKSIEPLPLNLNKIISTSNDVPKLTKGKSTDIETTNPEVDEIDTLMNEMNSNSDENLDDQNNESFSPSLETKRKTPSNSDIEDNKERDILNNIQHQFKPNSKTLRKKLSDDNDELPKIYKQKPVKRLETNNSEEKEPQEKSIEPLPLSLNKIISTSNDVPKLTKEKSTDIETTNPEVDEIDTLMNEMNSNSDENLDDQNNESFSPSLETKRKTPSNSDIEDNKERDILNNIQHQFKPNSKTLRKKLSDDNDELPKIYKQKPVKRLETNNSEEKEPQEKSIEPLPLNLNKIISTSNDVPKLTKGKSTDIQTTNPEVDEIDTLMNEMNSNSDENLNDQNNESRDKIDASNLSDDESDDHLTFIKDVLNEKEMKENSNDKPIPWVPTSVTIPNGETEPSTTPSLDENENIDRDGILRKATHPMIVEPALDGDVDNNRNDNLLVPSIPKDEEEIMNDSLNGNQEMNDLDIKSISSSLDELLDGGNKEIASQLHPIDFDAKIEENNKESLQKPTSKTTPEIPNVFEKNKSSEESYTKSQSPQTLEQSIANNYDEPITYSETQSIVNPSKDVDVFDILDDYNNLGGITMEGFDIKKTEDKTPSTTTQQKNDLTENNNSIPSIDKNTIKPEMADISDASNLSDDKSDDQLTFINDVLNEKEMKENSNDKSIAWVPTSVTIPNAETEPPTTPSLDENENIDRDGILRKATHPMIVEPALDGDVDNNRNDNLLVPSIPKDEEEIMNDSLNGNQEMNDLDFKSISSSLDELLDGGNKEIASQLHPIDFDAMIEENNKESLQKPTSKTTPEIPNVFEKNKSSEESYTKSQSSQTLEQSIANNYDEPITYSETQSIVNPSKDVDVFDILDDYNNLGGITMEGFDIKKTEDKTPSTTTQQKNDLTENNNSIPSIDKNTIKPEMADISDASNLSDDKSDDQLTFINDVLNEKEMKENSNDKSIAWVPTSVTIPNAETEPPTTPSLDENENIDRDGILRKATHPMIVEPALDGDVDNNRNDNLLVPSIPKDEEEIMNDSLNGNQEMNDLDFKSISSSLDELLDGGNKEIASQLHPIDFDAMIEENNKESLQKPTSKTTPEIPNVFEKNKSSEKSYTKSQSPQTLEQSIANNYDEPKTYSETQSIVNPSKDVDVFDILDDYNNLGGITMEDFDIKKTEDKTPSTTTQQKNDLTEKNNSIPSIDKNTIKPEIADISDASNLSDDKSDDQLTFINDVLNEKEMKENSNDKSIAWVPTSVTIPNAETEPPTTPSLDENENIDRDGILRKATHPKIVEPALDGDVDNNRNDNLLVPSIPKDEEEIMNDSLNGNQEMNDLDFKSISSSLDKLLDGGNKEIASQLHPIDFDAKIEENNKESLQKPTSKTTPEIPNVFEKNKSSEESYTKSQSPQTLEQSIANNYDEPKTYSETQSIVNPSKDVDVFDILDDYNNLGGITMEDFDIKKTEDKTPSTTTQQKNDLTENNNSIPSIDKNTIKPEIADMSDASNLSDDKSDDQLTFINDVLNEKEMKENSNDKSIAWVPTSVTIPNAETEPPTTPSLDENENIDRDGILRKATHPKIVEPALDGDVDNNRNDNLLVPSIPKDEEEIMNDSLNGNQEMNDLDFKSISSSLDELLDGGNKEIASQLHPIDFDAMIEENNKESLQKPTSKTTPEIPNVFEKNKSSEESYTKSQSPQTLEQSIANNYDEPKTYSETQSIVNPSKDVDVFDILDDYNNLGGITMEDFDIKKTEDKTPSTTTQQKNDLTENNNSIPSIDKNTIKPEIADMSDASNLSDDKSDDQLTFINDVLNEKEMKENSNDKSIAWVPTSVTIPNAETEPPTTPSLDENENIDRDGILRKATHPKIVEPALDGDVDNNRNDNLLVPSIPKDEEEIMNDSLNGNQEMNDLDFKSISSSLDELLDGGNKEIASQLHPIDFDAKIEENNKESLQKPTSKTTPEIPNVFEKNKSSEESYTKSQSPQTLEQSIANNYDEPKTYSEKQSIVNPSKDVDVFDILDDYNNLGGITMEDFDIKKTEDKTPSTTTQQKNDLTENNNSIPSIDKNTIKLEMADISDASNLSDDKSDDQLTFINDVLNEKEMKENSNDKSIAWVPTSVTIPNAETEPPTTTSLDENENIDRDGILRKATHPKIVEPALDGDVDNNKNDNLLVPSIPKDEEEIMNNSLNGNQEMNDIDFKSISSSLDELLDGGNKEIASQLHPIDFDAKIEENNKESLQKPTSKTTPEIPNVFEKNKSSEESYTKSQSPQTLEQSIANNYDEPKTYSETQSIVNPSKDVDVFDILDDYNNLGGITMEDFDIKKTEDKTPSTTTQQKNDLTENNNSIPSIDKNTIKLEMADISDASNLSDDKSDDQLTFINDVLNEKEMKENSNDKSIAWVPTSVTIPNAETEPPTTTSLDENENIDRDGILRKATHPKIVEPALDGDVDNNKNDNLLVPSIPKDEEEIMNNSLNGNQEMNDLDFKSISSSLDELLDGGNKEIASQLHPIDFDAMIEENNKESLQKPTSKTTPEIPNVFEKNKSSEESYTKSQSPQTLEQSIANNYDEPKTYSETQSIVNPSKDVDVFDILDDYNNLGGITMEDFDIKKTEDKTPSTTTQQKNDLTENNNSIPSIDKNTIKPEMADMSDASNLSDDKSDDQLTFINDVLNEKEMKENSNDKSIAWVPTSVTIPNAETEPPTTPSLDENENIDRDGILRKATHPKTVEPALDGDVDNNRNDNLLVPSIPKDEEEIMNNSLNGNQEMKDLDFKSISSSLDELLDGGNKEIASQLHPIDFDDFDATIKESSQKLTSKTTPEIPNVFEKNKSLEKSYIKSQSPHTPEQSIAIVNSSHVDGDNGKKINSPIPSIKKSEDGMPKRVLSGNSQNTVRISNSGHNFFNPNSVNPKVSPPEKHILIPNKDEHSSVLNIIDKHNNDLLGVDGDTYEHGDGETKHVMDYDLNSKDLSENKNKNILYNQIEQQYKNFLRKAHNNEHTNFENLKKFGKTKMNNNSFLLANDDSKVNTHDGPNTKYYDLNHMDKLTKITNVKNNINHYTPSIMVSSEDNTPFISDYNLMSEYDNPYGYMLPKFSTKYVEGGDSNNNLWENVPPKKNNVFTTHKESENFNDINQSDGYNMNSRISNHMNNDKKVGIESETVQNSYVDKENIDIHNNLYNDFLKKMSEQLIKKIDNIDDKISKFDNSSNNGSYIKENYNIRTDYPSTKQIILMNDLPNSEPKNENNIEEPNSKSVESLETVISNKSNDENEIKEFTKRQKDKHKKLKNHKKKLKKHSKHDRHKKKKSLKKNEIIDNDNDFGSHKKYKGQKKKNIKNDDDRNKKNKKNKKNEIMKNDSDDDSDDDDDDDDVDDDDDDGGGKRKKKIHKKYDINDDDDDNGKRKKKSHKKNYINDDDDGERKKKSLKKNHINDDDNSKRKKKSRKKNDINDDDDNGKRKKKSHMKNYIIEDDNNDGKRKMKSHKKNYINDNDVEVSRSKKTDNKKKKKKKENTSPQECNEVNISTSLQISSEDNDSMKALKMKSKSKNSKKINSTKSKKSMPKKKSKHKKQLKSFNYTNKEITVDASDKDSSSYENNYNSKKTYITTSISNNQNNAPKEKKHKHLELELNTYKKPLKTKKIYKYKEIPVNKEDKSSDESNGNLEETYNINITNDDKALKQKRLKHKRLKKMKNIDINIVKDTDNQVLNKDTNTRQGYQFYAFYPQYRYTNPFGRLFY